MKPSDLCIVIPVFNEAERLATAIRSVRDAGQIIIVDGGSSDDSVKIAHRYPGTVVVSSERGRGRQLAKGATLCTLDAMVFLHGDCHLSPGTLERIALALAGGKHWGATSQSIEATEYRYRVIEKGNAARVRLLGLPYGDQAMFVRTDLYRCVGGFEDVPLMEDVRLAQRLRKHSWPALVKGPVIASARRWRRRGVIRQTILNWSLLLLHRVGVSTEWLATRYR